MRYFPISLIILFFMSVTAASVNAQSRFDPEKRFAQTTIGELDVFVIVDTPSEFTTETFIGAGKELMDRLAGGKKLPSSINAFVIRKGERFILVDAGLGNGLAENLKAAGIAPERIDSILLTHSHGDHVGGLFQGEKAFFPNAKIWITAKELEFWADQRNKTALDRCRKVYGEFQRIEPDGITTLLIPEITAFDLAGHTPGHTGFLIRSQGKSFFISADLQHSMTLQFPHPEICARFDRDPSKSVDIRRRMMARAAREQWIYAGAHLPYPGFGLVHADGDAFRLDQPSP